MNRRSRPPIRTGHIIHIPSCRAPRERTSKSSWADITVAIDLRANSQIGVNANSWLENISCTGVSTTETMGSSNQGTCRKECDLGYVRGTYTAGRLFGHQICRGTAGPNPPRLVRGDSSRHIPSCWSNGRIGPVGPSTGRTAGPGGRTNGAIYVRHRRP